MEIFARWLIGLIIVSLAIGSLITYIVLGLERFYIKRETGLRPGKEFAGSPAWLTGLLERLFFTVLVAFNMSATAVAMIGWITVKMMTNWNRLGTPKVPELAWASLLADLVSMFFALIGGLICAGRIWI